LSGESPDALLRELEKARAELRVAREQIAAMEMSKFWKLRNLWWKIRGRVERLRAEATRAETSATSAPVAEGRAWLEPTTTAWGPPPLAEAVDVFVLSTPGDAAARASVDSATRRSPARVRVTPVESPGEMTRALAESQAPWVAVVDAPVEFPEDWIERLVAGLQAEPRAVAAVPLSRATPGMESAWQAALGAFPDFSGFSARVAVESGRLRPAVGAVARGALLVRRAALDSSEFTGLPDLARSLEHGGPVLLADDVAIDLKSGAGGGSAPAGRVASGIASRLASLADVERARQAGKRHEGRRVLFVLPVVDRGGGANIVLREGRAMTEMGIDARVVNLRDFESGFRRSYPAPELPVTFAHPGEIPELARDYDAVVATANTSVEWLAPLVREAKAPVLGYYIQDFEPYFYARGSAGYAKALSSYTIVPSLVRFAKTDWNARHVSGECGVPCAVVGPSFETSLFRPTKPRPPAAPLRVAAMIRPSSPRRQPELTLRILERAWKVLGKEIEITLFGETRHPDGRPVVASFPHRHLGLLDAVELARVFNDVHVFCDFSSYQAMGLTAMEAMACGATAILPRDGGAGSFAIDGQNALVVDTSAAEAGLDALARLARDPELCARLGDRALVDLSAFAPERSAERTLEVLFPGA
jgi:glycosyltransferase involved in cell wall biosynthesis